MTKELIEKIEDAHRRVRKIGPDAIYETELREVLRAAADALSARQPSEDDREATEAEIDKAARALHMAKCCSLSGDSPHDFPEASEVFAAGVVLNAVPRAAVPDAATERERAELWRSLDWMLWGVGMGDVFREPLADKMIAALSDAEFDQAQDLIRGWDERRGGPHERNLFVGIKAERDAALAALERVRAVCLHLGGVDGDVSQPAPSYYVSVGRNVVATEVLAALDGAPEPNWEYGWMADKERRASMSPRGPRLLIDGHPHTPEEIARFPRGQRVRRRKAGPWLPVEGESSDA